MLIINENHASEKVLSLFLHALEKHFAKACFT